MKPSSRGIVRRSQTRDRQLTSAALHRTPTPSDRQFDPGASRRRAERSPAQRANRVEPLGRVKYTVPIGGHGPPGHLVTQAWIDVLAQSDRA
jgi:hypothetical protein